MNKIQQPQMMRGNKQMTNTIKVVSLFSGIGGFEVGLKQSKIKSKVVFAFALFKIEVF